MSVLTATLGDCNQDGVVDYQDLNCACGSKEIDEVLAATGLLLGDLDGNESVDFADFLKLSANFGNDVADYLQGDLDCSGDVSFEDFLTLSANFGKSSQAIATVPEPSYSPAWIVVCILLTLRIASPGRNENQT